MAEEMESHKKNLTWIFVDRSTNEKIICCKQVYKSKLGILDIENLRYKARFVA